MARDHSAPPNFANPAQNGLVPIPDTDAAREQAYAALCELAEQLEPTALAYIIAGMTIVIIVLGVAIEVENFGFGAALLFPDMSNGESMDAVTAPLKLALGAAMLMGHFLVRKGTEFLGRWCTRLIDLAGLIAVGGLIFGAMTFLPSTIQLAADANGDTGAATAQASHSMGIIASMLFPISAFSTHTMMGFLVSAVMKIVRMRGIRQKMADIRRQVDQLSANLAAIHDEDQTIEAMRVPGAMEWRTATAIATTVGEYASAMSDHCIARKTLEEAGGRSDLDVGLPDGLKEMSLKRMDEIGGYLARWTPAFVFHLLTKKETTHA